MQNNEKPSRQLFGSSLLTLVIAVVLTLSLILGYRTLFLDTPIAQTPTQDGEAQLWPTPPPTFTPLPISVATTVVTTPTQTPTPVPSPTPISLPVWSQIEELGVVKYTLSTDVEVSNDTENKDFIEWLNDRFGTDRVRIRAVGIVRVGFDLSQLQGSDSDVETNERTISITLPEPQVLSVELLPDKTEIVEQSQRMLRSKYPGLEIEALGKAKDQLEQLVADNPSMLDLAKELTQFRLTERLKSFGFSYITIKFRPSEQ